MKHFSFLNTVVLINGVRIEEWAPGEDSLVVTRRVESFNDVIGSTGDMAVFQTSDFSGTFEMKLLQTSKSNEYLTQLMIAAENGAFVPIFSQYKDLGGNDLASGTNGYIQKYPEVSRGAGIAVQPWLVVVERLDLLLGGTDAL